MEEKKETINEKRGFRFREARKAAALSQEKLLDIFQEKGIDVKTTQSIRNWERGKCPPSDIRVYDVYAEISGFHADYLRGTSDYKTASSLSYRIESSKKLSDRRRREYDFLIKLISERTKVKITHDGEKNYSPYTLTNGNDQFEVNAFAINNILEEMISSCAGTIDNLFFILTDENKP